MSTHYENEIYEEIGSILDEYCVGDYDFIVPNSVDVIDIYPHIYSNMEHNLGYDGKYLYEIFDCLVSPDDYDKIVEDCDTYLEKLYEKYEDYVPF